MQSCSTRWFRTLAGILPLVVIHSGPPPEKGFARETILWRTAQRRQVLTSGRQVRVSNIRTTSAGYPPGRGAGAAATLPQRQRWHFEPYRAARRAGRTGSSLGPPLGRLSRLDPHRAPAPPIWRLPHHRMMVLLGRSLGLRKECGGNRFGRMVKDSSAGHAPAPRGFTQSGPHSPRGGLHPLTAQRTVRTTFGHLGSRGGAASIRLRMGESSNPYL